MQKKYIPFTLSLLALSLASCSFVIPGSSGSSSATPSVNPSSTSAQSDDFGQYDMVLSMSTSGTGAIGPNDSVFIYSGTGLAGVSGTGLYHHNGPLALGGRFSTGSLELTLDQGRRVSKFVLLAGAYGSDYDVPVALQLDNVSLSPLYLNEKGIYEFDVSDVNLEITTITLATTSEGERADIYKIGVNYGEVETIYPTAIAFATQEYKVKVGKSRGTSLSFTPSGANVREVTYESSDTSIFTVDATGKISGVAEGSATLTAKAKAKDDGFVTATTTVTVSEDTGETERTEIAQTYNDLQNNNLYALDACPSVGTPKLLIIPVWFTDSDKFIAASKRESVRDDIRKAYLGTPEETGWHSVKTFYEEESDGALTLNGTVSEWYEINQKYADYGPESAQDKTLKLVSSAADWYFLNHPGEKRTDYDSDGNGYLDGVMLIYGAPDMNHSPSDGYGNLWAYCFWTQDVKAKSVQNPGANVYFWASYDFLYGTNALSRTGKSSYASGDTRHCEIDAHTFIHEMGHVFGLDDYYDYGKYGYSHAGAFSMQDYNRGGHDAFSCLALGWADPYIPDSSCEITIGAFQKTHETILLTPSWNDFDSAFDEYLLLELYTPTGLNEFDCTYAYEGDTQLKGPNAVGIRLWHVNSTLVYVYNGDYGTLPSGDVDFTSDVHHSGEGVTQAFTNTVGDEDYGSPLGSGYDDYNLLRLIRNNTGAPLHSYEYFNAASLFGDGSSFSMEKYKSQFANAAALDSGEDLGWSFEVSISGTGDDAVATITLTQA